MFAQVKQKIKNLLPKNDFARGVSVLVGGTVGAQALMVLASPILTRLYTPEDFGLLAVYISILSLFTVIASLRYALAIPLAEKEEDAAYIVVLSLFIVSVITGLSALVVFIVGNSLAELIKAPVMADFFWLIPFGVFALGCYQVYNYWAIRTKKFGNIAKTKLTQSVVIIAVQLLSFKFGALALIIGQTCGQAVGVISLARPTFNNQNFRKWTWRNLKEVAIRYKKFPLYGTWSGFLNTAGMQLPPLLFAIFFSAGAAGFYALAHRILAMPMSLIGSAVGSVFHANAAEAYREDKLAPLFEAVYSKLVSIIMPILVVLVIDAPRLFALVFGESWEEAGDLARWMAPWLAVVFIASPLSVLFDVLERQKAGMYFQGLILAVRVLAICIGYKNGSMLLAISLFSLFSLLCWSGFLVWVTKISSSRLVMLYPPLLKSALLALICTSPLLIIKIFDLNTLFWYGAMVFTIIFILSYYFYIFRHSFLTKANSQVNDTL